jgi:hypothetical protein
VAYRANAGKRIVLTVLAAAAVLALIGVIVSAVFGRAVSPSISWTFVIGGGVIVVLNVVGSGSARALADPRSGSSFGKEVEDATTSAGWLIVGLVLVGIGVVGLIA